MGKPTKKFLMENFIKYYKANKTYRKQLLVKWGVETEQELFKIVNHKPKFVVKELLPKVKPAPEKKEVKVVKSNDSVKNPIVDYVIAFDTTGSMSSYLEGVKKHVTELIPKLLKSSKNLLIKIVAFGDYIDMDNYQRNIFGNAYQVLELTNSQKDLIQFVKEARETEGGDRPEFYGLVMQKIRTETQWRKNAKKVVLLIADAENHKMGKTRDGFINSVSTEEETLLAKKENITYDTLSIRSEKWYEELSKLTGGVHVLYNEAEGVNHIFEASVYSRTSSDMYEAKVKSLSDTKDTVLFSAVKQFGKLI